MAPSKPRPTPSKPRPSASKPRPSASKTKLGNKNKAKPTLPSVGKSKSKVTKPLTKLKKKRRVYTEQELDIPKLNMITPAGVVKPKGKKKGKVFVDDQASMMTILAMVNADKEGQIESKMMKARQMEEIRQARQKEMEARQEQKKSKLDETKKSLRRQRKSKDSQEPVLNDSEKPPAKSNKKRVSFG